MIISSVTDSQARHWREGAYVQVCLLKMDCPQPPAMAGGQRVNPRQANYLFLDPLFHRITATSEPRTVVDIPSPESHSAATTVLNLSPKLTILWYRGLEEIINQAVVSRRMNDSIGTMKEHEMYLQTRRDHSSWVFPSRDRIRASWTNVREYVEHRTQIVIGHTES